MATPHFAWGIDVGNRALKAIKLARDGDTFRIDDFEVIEHEQILSQAGDNRESLLQSSLAHFAQKHSAKGGTVAIGVSGQASFARFIKLPPVDPSKIAEIVKFEAVQQIPFPLEDVEWSYQLFQAKDSPEVEVGIFAMRRELVNQTINNFTDVGLEVNTVQMNPLADYNGLYYDDRITGTTMIVDIGAENSDLIIAEGENIWMRSIPIGGNNFTEALVKAFKLKFPKAEELKRNAATSKYGRQILQAMKPVFADLVGEIQRSIGFYSSTHRESRIEKVLALGGTFRLPGLQKYLQSNLSLDVVRIDRLNAPAPADAKFAAAFNENILSSVAAYGLALQALGQGKISSSLLPEKIKRERMWRDKTPWFAAAAALFLAAPGIAISKYYIDTTAFDHQENVRTQIASISGQGKTLAKRWTNEVENSGSEDRTQITNYLSLLEGRDLVIDITNEIGKAIPTPSKAELAKPRAQREIVELAGWTMRYEPEMGPILAMPDDEFNRQVDKVETLNANGGGGSFTGGGGSFTGGGGRGMERPGRPMGGQRPGPMMPPPTANPAAPSGPSTQRGYLLTIICHTPVQDSTRLIAATVAQTLRNRNQKASDPPPRFSIERVTIPSAMRVSAMAPAGGIIQQVKPPLVFTPPGANPGNGGASPPVYQPDPRVRPPLDRGGNVPPGVPGIATGGAPAADPFPDPMHKGESMRDDSMVTVLAAIVIDPPPLVKTDQPAQISPINPGIRFGLGNNV